MNTFSSRFVSIEALQQKIAAHTDAALLAPIDGKWSVLQHLYHCWLVERGVLAYIKLKTQKPDSLEQIRLLTRLRFFFFFTILKVGLLKVKAPRVVQAFPENMNRKDLFERLAKTREEADLFFADFPEVTARKGIFKHVFIGRLNKALTQKFIKLHLAHHLKLCGL
tara:strand:- start:1081 stop:1578 length:498 start_codon:yes stop_codon:yes gene_type:complete